MAKLDRKDVQIFAENSKETLITEFRTEDPQGFTASFSRDPDVIQNENYSQGWVNDTNNFNTKIYGEDLNAVNYVLSYLLKYLYENGIAEWKSTTTYYLNSICKVENALYLSLQNDNIGNDPISTVGYWKLIPLENVSIEDTGSGFSIVKDVTDNVITFKTISVTGYGEITDTGDQLNIDIAGGGGGGTGDAYWGTIRGTITNQTDLMTLINLKQDIFTVDSPLVLTDEQHLTINKATSSVSGYLDYNDFNTFSGKQDTISATLPISITNNNIEIETAGTLTTGALSYTDWNTFNNKQNAINGLIITETSTTFDAVPKSTITTSNIGSSTYPITNIYSGTSYNNTTNTSLVTNTPDSNNTTDININGFRFLKIDDSNDKILRITESGTGFTSQITVDEISGNTSVKSDLIASKTGNTGSIGTSTNAFPTGYINEVNSTTVKVGTLSPKTGNTDINISSDLIPSTNTINLGSSNNKFQMAHIGLTYTGSLTSTGTGGININSDLVPTTGQYLGSSTKAFGKTYTDEINVATIVGTATSPNTGSIIAKGRFYLYEGTTEKLQFGFSQCIPASNKTYNLGSSGNSFNGIYGASFVNTSDVRLKDNIVEYTDNALNKIGNFTPIKYNFKDEPKENIKLGLSAQEVMNQESLCVIQGKSDDDYIGIDIYALNTLCIKAIKELKTKVESLEKEVAELKGQTK